jgi:hypothetical protein
VQKSIADAPFVITESIGAATSIQKSVINLRNAGMRHIDIEKYACFPAELLLFAQFLTHV